MYQQKKRNLEITPAAGGAHEYVRIQNNQLSKSNMPFLLTTTLAAGEAHVGVQIQKILLSKPNMPILPEEAVAKALANRYKHRLHHDCE